MLAQRLYLGCLLQGQCSKKLTLAGVSPTPSGSVSTPIGSNVPGWPLLLESGEEEASQVAEPEVLHQNQLSIAGISSVLVRFFHTLFLHSLLCRYQVLLVNYLLI